LLFAHETFSLQKIETQHRKTCVILYFNQLNETKVCPQIKAIRMNKVANIKQSAVKIYDYYEIGESSQKSFMKQNQLLSFQKNEQPNFICCLQQPHVACCSSSCACN